MRKDRDVSFLLSDDYGPGSSACNQDFVGRWFRAFGAGCRKRATTDSDSRNDAGIWFMSLGNRHPLAACLTSSDYFYSQNLIVFPLSS